MRLSPLYIQDNLVRDEDKQFQLYEHLNEPGFLRVRLYSRLFTAYRVNEENRVHPYYCACQN